MSQANFNTPVFLKLLKSGSHRAYESLMDMYYQKLCTYALSLCHSPHGAEDIVQNVFFKLWKKRKKLNLSNSKSISGFLYRSVYNEFIDQYRKRKSVLLLEKKYMDALDLIIDEKEEASIDKLLKRVKQEIENLPSKYRRTFLLSKHDGLTNTEIADYLGVSIKTVEAHISRCYQIIRHNVSDVNM